MNKLIQKAMLGVAISVGAMSLTARPAHAQWHVFDSANFGKLIVLGQQGASQLRQVTSIAGYTEQQLQQLTGFYQSFAHLTDASQVAALLQSPMVRDALPEVSQLESQLQGVGGFNGSLASQINQFRSQNQIYTPSGSDQTAEWINQRANATAGQMAAADSLLQASNARSQGMQQLLDRLSTAKDPKDVMDLNTRINAENGMTQNQNLQAQAALMMQQAQERAEREREEQAWREGSDSLSDAANAAAAAADGGTVSQTSSVGDN